MTEGVAIMGSGRPGAAQPRVSEVEMLSAVDRRSGTVRIRHQDNVPAAEPLLGALPLSPRRWQPTTLTERDALMIEIARMRDDDWQTLRELRLHALAEAPYAFWATRADEVTYTEAQWRQFLRAATWYVARRDSQLVGLAAGLLRQEIPDEPELIAMWVAPTERGRGTGTQLAEEIMAWARGRGATAMTLWVTDGNTAARRLYQRVGFNTTGERGPVPHSAAAGMERMRIHLD
jgi:GNAT superfamily N-acetyltransferase